jgi:hypothetical protein
MVRALGLALLLAVATAAPAEADGPQAGNGIAGLGRRGGDELRPAGGAPAAAVRLPGALALAETSQRAGGLRRESQEVDRGTAPATLTSERPKPQGSLVLPWLSQRRSSFALPLTERLALGVGYRHIRGEDLWREFADLGSIDYESHNFVFRAYWRF